MQFERNAIRHFFQTFPFCPPIYCGRVKRIVTLLIRAVYYYKLIKTKTKRPQIKQQGAVNHNNLITTSNTYLKEEIIMISTSIAVMFGVAAGLGTIGAGIACVYNFFKKH